MNLGSIPPHGDALEASSPQPWQPRGCQAAQTGLRHAIFCEAGDRLYGPSPSPNPTLNPHPTPKSKFRSNCLRFGSVALVSEFRSTCFRFGVTDLVCKFSSTCFRFGCAALGAGTAFISSCIMARALRFCAHADFHISEACNH